MRRRARSCETGSLARRLEAAAAAAVLRLFRAWGMGGGGVQRLFA